VSTVAPALAAGRSSDRNPVAAARLRSGPRRELEPTATFTLTDGRGNRVAAAVGQIGDGTWALFPVGIFLASERTYTARLAPGICGLAGNCTRDEVVWNSRSRS
jgi:hypothetical protein